ncbi:MAG TPA: hypothetical protein VFM85_05720 [Actinomycetota bacterium]|nr:hypothetical protein [Actinomycetota bacterium]
MEGANCGTGGYLDDRHGYRHSGLWALEAIFEQWLSKRSLARLKLWRRETAWFMVLVYGTISLLLVLLSLVQDALLKSVNRMSALSFGAISCLANPLPRGRHQRPEKKEPRREIKETREANQ